MSNGLTCGIRNNPGRYSALAPDNEDPLHVPVEQTTQLLKGKGFSNPPRVQQLQQRTRRHIAYTFSSKLLYLRQGIKATHERFSNKISSAPGTPSTLKKGRGPVLAEHLEIPSPMAEEDACDEMLPDVEAVIAPGPESDETRTANSQQSMSARILNRDDAEFATAACKAKPSIGVCSWHEISYSSPYTRPAAEVLREACAAKSPRKSNSEQET